MYVCMYVNAYRYVRMYVCIYACVSARTYLNRYVYIYVCTINYMAYYVVCGPGRSVGIATDYGMVGRGIESRWGRDFSPVQTGPGAHPASCKMGTVSFPGVKYGRGVLLTTHPLLAPRSWKSRATPLPTLWATIGPVTGTLYLYLLLCSIFYTQL